MFGGRKRKKAERRRLIEAEAERLEALAIPDLAAAVMQAGWGSDGPRQNQSPGGMPKSYVVQALAPAKLHVAGYRRLEALCDEGLAALERAGLLVGDLSRDERPAVRWRPSRAGVEALEQGQIRENVDQSEPG